MNTAPVLLGPANPDHFRRQVGRFKERHYVDPLPGDEVAPATEAAWPSFTTVKGAATPTWNASQAVAIKRIARSYRMMPERLAGLDERDTIAVLHMWNEGDLSRAGDRGMAVHHYVEYVKLRNMSPLVDLTAARPYMAAVDAFFDAYGPRLVAAEIVVIHRHLNGVGYGGTIDAILVLTIDGKRYVVDWKSRAEDAEHTVYGNEAAQIGAYAGAEYAIMDRDGVPTRVRMDELGIDGGLIVSIRPDGCRVYPVDLGAAFDHFSAMHAWWCAGRDENLSIGPAWAPVSATPRHLHAVPSTEAASSPRAVIGGHDGPTPVAPSVPPAPHTAAAIPVAARRDRLIARITELMQAGHGPVLAAAWPEGVPGLAAAHHTDEQLVAILHVVQRVSDAAGLPFHDDDGTPSVMPEEESAETDNTDVDATRPPLAAVGPYEGQPADVAALTALANRYTTLTDVQRELVRNVAAQADQAGRSISLSANPTVRRFELARLLVYLVEQTWNDERNTWADVFVRAVLAAVGHPSTDRDPVGAVLSALTIEEAVRACNIVQALGTEALTVSYDQHGCHLGGPVVTAWAD